eukprot:TRINITY_DN307_c2_g2_i1.p1 TRINITY_DN307_c2_g2~~TRINITY_DN307_c2_g2_i1.p1  ORF type:complete len:1229 (+),score=473.18 TRINITY_DN307_c2_g2_i1:223-3687(+)
MKESVDMEIDNNNNNDIKSNDKAKAEAEEKDLSHPPPSNKSVSSSPLSSVHDNKISRKRRRTPRRRRRRTEINNNNSNNNNSYSRDVSHSPPPMKRRNSNNNNVKIDNRRRESSIRRSLSRSRSRSPIYKKQQSQGTRSPSRSRSPSFKNKQERQALHSSSTPRQSESMSKPSVLRNQQSPSPSHQHSKSPRKSTSRSRSPIMRKKSRSRSPVMRKKSRSRRQSPSRSHSVSQRRSRSRSRSRSQSYSSSSSRSRSHSRSPRHRRHRSRHSRSRHGRSRHRSSKSRSKGDVDAFGRARQLVDRRMVDRSVVETTSQSPSPVVEPSPKQQPNVIFIESEQPTNSKKVKKVSVPSPLKVTASPIPSAIESTPLTTKSPSPEPITNKPQNNTPKPNIDDTNVSKISPQNMISSYVPTQPKLSPLPVVDVQKKEKDLGIDITKTAVSGNVNNILTPTYKPPIRLRTPKIISVKKNEREVSQSRSPKVEFELSNEVPTNKKSQERVFILSPSSKTDVSTRNEKISLPNFAAVSKRSSSKDSSNTNTDVDMDTDDEEGEEGEIIIPSTTVKSKPQPIKSSSGMTLDMIESDNNNGNNNTTRNRVNGRVSPVVFEGSIRQRHRLSHDNDQVYLVPPGAKVSSSSSIKREPIKKENDHEEPNLPKSPTFIDGNEESHKRPFAEGSEVFIPRKRSAPEQPGLMHQPMLGFANPHQHPSAMPNHHQQQQQQHHRIPIQPQQHGNNMVHPQHSQLQHRQHQHQHQQHQRGLQQQQPFHQPIPAASGVGTGGDPRRGRIGASISANPMSPPPTQQQQPFSAHPSQLRMPRPQQFMTQQQQQQQQQQQPNSFNSMEMVNPSLVEKPNMEALRSMMSGMSLKAIEQLLVSVKQQKQFIGAEEPSAKRIKQEPSPPPSYGTRRSSRLQQKHQDDIHGCRPYYPSSVIGTAPTCNKSAQPVFTTVNYDNHHQSSSMNSFQPQQTHQPQQQMQQSHYFHDEPMRRNHSLEGDISPFSSPGDGNSSITSPVDSQGSTNNNVGFCPLNPMVPFPSVNINNNNNNNNSAIDGVTINRLPDSEFEIAAMTTHNSLTMGLDLTGSPLEIDDIVDGRGTTIDIFDSLNELPELPTAGISQAQFSPSAFASSMPIDNFDLPSLSDNGLCPVDFDECLM